MSGPITDPTCGAFRRLRITEGLQTPDESASSTRLLKRDDRPPIR